MYCCAYGCTQKYYKNSGISFHVFPRDPKRLKLWILAIRRKNFKPTSSTKICSKHFTLNSFDVKFGMRLLKKDAIPTIFNFPPYLEYLRPVKEKKMKCHKTGENTADFCDEIDDVQDTSDDNEIEEENNNGEWWIWTKKQLETQQTLIEDLQLSIKTLEKKLSLLENVNIKNTRWDSNETSNKQTRWTDINFEFIDSMSTLTAAEQIRRWVLAGEKLEEQKQLISQLTELKEHLTYNINKLKESK